MRRQVGGPAQAGGLGRTGREPHTRAFLTVWVDATHYAAAMTDPGDRSTALTNLDPETGTPDQTPAPAPEIGEAGSRAKQQDNVHDQAEKSKDFPDPTAL